MQERYHGRPRKDAEVEVVRMDNSRSRGGWSFGPVAGTDDPVLNGTNIKGAVIPPLLFFALRHCTILVASPVM